MLRRRHDRVAEILKPSQWLDLFVGFLDARLARDNLVGNPIILDEQRHLGGPSVIDCCAIEAKYVKHSVAGPLRVNQARTEYISDTMVASTKAVTDLWRNLILGHVRAWHEAFHHAQVGELLDVGLAQIEPHDREIGDARPTRLDPLIGSLDVVKILKLAVYVVGLRREKRAAAADE